ncbi:hypothetical protein GGI07_002496 [Coemansia sp. Benny D115]|nr:hypothetical protein GGI07_002496 [Coemansia sp. Benny D115]
MDSSASKGRSADMRNSHTTGNSGFRQTYISDSNGVTPFPPGLSDSGDPYGSPAGSRSSLLSPRSRHSPQQMQGGGSVHRRSATMFNAGGGSGGQAEVNPVTAWGLIASNDPLPPPPPPQMQRANGYASPSGHKDKGRHHQMENTVNIYGTPSTAHRPSISTVLSSDVSRAGAAAHHHPPPMSDSGRSFSTPRGLRTRQAEAVTPLTRRNSNANFDTFPDRSFGSSFAMEPHLVKRNSVHIGAGLGVRGSVQENSALTPETPGMSVDGTGHSRHSRVNSLMTPPRARELEKTHNALESGARTNRGLTVATGMLGEHHGRLPVAGHSAGPYPEYPGRDALSDNFSWGASDAIRARTGSFAFSATARQSTQDANLRGAGGQQPGDPGRHAHRASYAGSVQGSSVIGSGGYYGNPRTGSSNVGSNARKSRPQSLQAKGGKTPIRSNWYYKDEMLSDSDVKDQDFSSSDEEDFGKDGVDYCGDMVAQQKLIQKQQREIFDLNLHCKLMKKALSSKTQQPFEAIIDQNARTCASNRKINRENEILKESIQKFKAQIEQLQMVVSNPPPCMLDHGMSQEEKEQVDMLQEELENTRRELDVQISLARQRAAMIEEKDSAIRNLEEDLTRERLASDQWQRKAYSREQRDNSYSRAGMDSGDSSAYMAASAHQHNQQAAQAADSLPFRLRAGTNTTTSETVTLRAPSDVSGVGSSVSHHHHHMQHNQWPQQSMNGSPMSKLENKVEVLEAFQNLEALNRSLKDELKQTKAALKKSEEQCSELREKLKASDKKTHDLGEQRRAMQNELKRTQSITTQLTANGDNELTRLVEENEALFDECQTLRHELEEAKKDFDKRMMAAVDDALNNMHLDDDDEDEDNEYGNYEGDDMGTGEDGDGDGDSNGKSGGRRHGSGGIYRNGSASQRAEISRLNAEYQDALERAKSAEDHVLKLQEELAQVRDRMNSFIHGSLRPYLRETTVDPTRAEDVHESVRQWSQLKVVVPPSSESDVMDTPTKKGNGVRNNYSSMFPVKRHGSLTGGGSRVTGVASAPIDLPLSSGPGLASEGDDADFDSFETELPREYETARPGKRRMPTPIYSSFDSE